MSPDTETDGKRKAISPLAATVASLGTPVDPKAAKRDDAVFPQVPMWPSAVPAASQVPSTQGTPVLQQQQAGGGSGAITAAAPPSTVCVPELELPKIPDEDRSLPLTKGDFMSAFQSLQICVTGLNTTLQSFGGRLENVEHNVQIMAGQQQSLEARVAALEQQARNPSYNAANAYGNQWPPQSAASSAMHRSSSLPHSFGRRPQEPEWAHVPIHQRTRCIMGKIGYNCHVDARHAFVNQVLNTDLSLPLSSWTMVAGPSSNMLYGSQVEIEFKSPDVARETRKRVEQGKFCPPASKEPVFLVQRKTEVERLPNQSIRALADSIRDRLRSLDRNEDADGLKICPYTRSIWLDATQLCKIDKLMLKWLVSAPMLTEDDKTWIEEQTKVLKRLEQYRS